MAALQDPAAAAADWDVLDVDDSDIRLDAPSSSPLRRPCAAPASHSHQDEPPHPSQPHRVPGPTAAAAVPDMTRLRSIAGSPLAGLGRGGAQAPGADFLLPRGSARSSSSVRDNSEHVAGKERGWAQPGIKAIREKEELRRAPQVAGVVTTCKPNGLGDLLVTLKDPTDTIAATVHKKVLLEGNNGEDITVGCVIVLSKVPVFRPTPKACYLSITKVIKVFRKDCDAPPKQVISSNTTERSECSTNNIMMRLVGHERMVHSNTEVSLEHQGPPDSSNSSSAQDSYGTCSLGNTSNQEGGLQMLAGVRRSTQQAYGSTGHPQQSLNIPNIACSQPSLCGSTDIFGVRHCTQASDDQNLRRPFDNEEMLHGSKRLKINAFPPDGSGGTANSRIDTENNHVLERNMNSVLDDTAEQCASIRQPVEHQQSNFIAANAGSLQPKEAVSVALGTEWTDDQLCQLFLDY